MFKPNSLDRIEKRIDALAELDPWLKLPPKLEKADGSSVHRLVSAMQDSNVLWLLARPGTDPSMRLTGLDQMQTFLVQHDWAAAFHGATDFESGDFELPFTLCCFEFRMNGRRVCATIRQHEKSKEITVLVETRSCWAIPVAPFKLVDGFWKPLGNDDTAAMLPPFLGAQIRAICISLEANVAATDAIEADAKLQAARVRRGKEPLPTYHLVKLAHREHHGAGRAGDEDYTKRRLHFRRGHWRHLTEERKVWVRWCLVGDPDLGFIDKQYVLGTGKTPITAVKF